MELIMVLFGYKIFSKVGLTMNNLMDERTNVSVVLKFWNQQQVVF